MKVTVDKSLCTGCGLCTDNCPEVFEMQGDTAVAKIQVVTGQDVVNKVKEAAENCPVEAIKTG
ncbi:MAG: ferredoxin [Ignavibacteria bacterium]|nr:ferredoxin [Ignavibacteria bacterium]